MRTRQVAIIAAAIASICSFGGCTANVHDNTLNTQADLTFHVDVSADHVKPGDSVPITMDATGVVLVEPNAQPAPADADKASFFKIFLDNEDSEPLITTAQMHVQVTIPKDATEGKHHLICRLFKHDGTATDQEQSVSINVSASASVTVNSDAGAVVTTDAGAANTGVAGAGSNSERFVRGSCPGSMVEGERRAAAEWQRTACRAVLAQSCKSERRAA